MRTGSAVSVLAVTAVLLAGPAGVPAGAVAGSCPPAWRIQPTPNASSRDNVLGSLAVVSGSDIWSVGSHGRTDARSTLTEHWNGSSWTIVPSPNGDGRINYLTDVSEVSSRDVWAVGFTADGDQVNETRTLVEHWNGSAWKVVPSPNPQPDLGGGYSDGNQLFGVAAFASDDVWAVGLTSSFVGGRTLIEHWNGERWSSVRAPHPSSYSELRSISGSGPNDVWAVGNYYDHGLQQSLMLHFDGSRWTRVPSGNVGPYLNMFLSVSAVSPTDAWAVGYHLAVFGFSEVYQTAALHWDGSTWAPSPTPNVNQENNYLRGVDAVSAGDVWAVGFWDTGTQLLTLIEHWDGEDWTIVPSPNHADSVINELYGVAAVSPNEVWTVGQYSGFTSFRTFAQRYRDTC